MRKSGQVVAHTGVPFVMPLFEAFLDVEAGQHGAEAAVVRPRPQNLDPARLRHRAQNSQRFVVGEPVSVQKAVFFFMVEHCDESHAAKIAVAC